MSCDFKIDHKNVRVLAKKKKNPDYFNYTVSEEAFIAQDSHMRL